MPKYLKLFETHQEYETYLGGGEMILPNVSHCIDQNDVHYNPKKQEVTLYTITNISISGMEHAFNYTFDREIEEEIINPRVEYYVDNELAFIDEAYVWEGEIYSPMKSTAGQWTIILKFDSGDKIIKTQPYNFEYIPFT